MSKLSNIPEFSVSEFSRNIKRIIEDAFGYVKIRGEISGLKKATSGHIYFALKDEQSLISAVCFRNMAQAIEFEAKDGMEVVASGRVTIYEGRSNYQIIVEKLEIAGIGAILESIEKRRQKLFIEGLFDQKYKKKLPRFPKIIAVITSPTGAVIEDIINRITNRFPTNLLLYPVLVQGKTAASEIIAAIKYFNHQSESKKTPPDVIIIARGGGSFEDLLPFNDEELVRAVFASAIPIISAIGHETDTTLIDYVSDLRAPTPSAAAEIATPVLNDFKILLNNLEKRLNNYALNLLLNQKNKLENLAKYLIHPKKLLQQIEQKISELEKRAATSLNQRLNNKEKDLKLAANLLISPDKILSNYQKQLQNLAKNLSQNLQNQLQNRQNKISWAEKLLISYDYKRVLKRGYALVRDVNNQVISTISHIQNDQKINVEMQDGKINAIVKLNLNN